LTIFEQASSPNVEKIEELEKEGQALRKEVADIKAQLKQLAALIKRK
jgi:uncharacterized protein (UPF0335 family)